MTVNLDFISRALRDPSFRDLINTSSLVVPDGIPVLWAAKLLGDPLPQRITGLDLLHACCRLAQGTPEGIFLLGAEPGVALRASRALCGWYPELPIAGTYSPPFGEFSVEENSLIVDLIVSSGAQYLFVAFGCPKQDFWIREHLVELGVPVCVGIGGVFNYVTGRVKRAPRCVQNLGLEWLVRMMQQPRLAKRYLINDLPVLTRVISHKLLSAHGVNNAGQQSAGQLFTRSGGLRRMTPRE